MQLLIGIIFLTLSTAVYSHGGADAGPTDKDRHIQFPDTEQYKTLVVDLHTHSTFSDGHVWPTIRISEALRDGLDAIAITEHLEWQPHLADIPHPDRNRSFEIAKQAAEGLDLMVITGTEITREAPAGHMNAIFIKDANELFKENSPPSDPADTRGYYIDTGQWPAQEAVEAANEQGAFVFWNHPYWTRQSPDGIARMPAFHADNAENGLLHGIEVANGGTYSEEAFAIALEHNLALIGVSDVHNLIDWDYEPHNGGHRPVTLVLAESDSIDGIREALFARRTIVWFKNLLLGREPSLSSLIDASIQVVAANYLPATNVLRVEIQNSSDAAFILQNRTDMTFMGSHDTIELSANDRTILQVKPGADRSEVTLKFAVLNALTAPRAPLEIEWSLRP